MYDWEILSDTFFKIIILQRKLDYVFPFLKTTIKHLFLFSN